MASGERLCLDVEETIHSGSKMHKLDVIIGHIEDIIISEEFQNMQESFMEKYYQVFEDTEENKLIYTEIFKEYNEIIERYLTAALSQRIPKFSMEKFCVSLKKHENEISGDIFDMLLSFSDFILFKEMFINYKEEKEGKFIELNQGLVVTPLQANAVSPVEQNMKNIENGINHMTTGNHR